MQESQSEKEPVSNVPPVAPPTRKRSNDERTVTPPNDTLDDNNGHKQLKELQNSIETLKSEKKELQEELETYMGAADKEKTDLVMAEKKSRQHVRGMIQVVICYVLIGRRVKKET